MAMIYSPSRRAGSKKVLIKLLVSEDRFYGSILCLETQF